MNIRWKVTLLVAALFAVLGVAELVVARSVLMPSFTALENAEADIAMRRIDYALEATLDELTQSANGWGNWVDTYRFAQDHNRKFIENNVTVVGLRQLNVNSLVIADVRGRALTSAAIDLDSGHAIDLDLTTRGVLAANFPWRDRLLQGQVAHGFLRTRLGVLMLAGAPILDGFGRGPSRGMVLLGRLLSPAEVQRIGARAQARLAMLPPRAPDLAERVATRDAVQVFRTVRDLHGEPVLTLQVDAPREITRRGFSAVRYASIYLGAAAILVLVALVVFLDRVVLGPLAVVTRHAVAVGVGRDLTVRLDLPGNDEIGVLARELDRMVASLAQSRTQLVDQSFRAGFAELARGVLHNLGNAMTPIGVRLAGLKTMLASAPVQDAEAAIDELGGSDSDPARHRDMQEFLRLACGQLTGTLRAAQADLEVVDCQVQIVQGALAEQLGSTRGEHVIEAVRLSELIAQTLQLVPDPARERLLVLPQPSVHTCGAVSVPLTVLRLVLQNFIINAADAVREAGRANGTLRIDAEIVEEGVGRTLVMHCADDGVGIAPENLERIFENGFSTKSTATNFGIGLHWCANALGAIGGGVWATSAGRGMGACLHARIPLPAHADAAITQAA